MIVYLIAIPQLILIIYCTISTIIHKNTSPDIFDMKRKYDIKFTAPFITFTFCAASILITMDKRNTLIIAVAGMFFLCGLLFLVEGIRKPYISNKGVVANCKLYRWKDVKLIEIKDFRVVFQVTSFIGKRQIVVDLYGVKEVDVKSKLIEYIEL